MEIFQNNEWLLPQSKEELTSEILREKLRAFISMLIDKDPQKLIFLLYRLDIDETKLRKALLQESDSATVISEMIISRQLQKIEARKIYFAKGECDEEKW